MEHPFTISLLVLYYFWIKLQSSIEDNLYFVPLSPQGAILGFLDVDNESNNHMLFLFQLNIYKA